MFSNQIYPFRLCFWHSFFNFQNFLVNLVSNFSCFSLFICRFHFFFFHRHGKFQFEAVYGKGIKGEDIFDERIQSFLDAFLDYGYNITYLVFGESASGQVETFFGEETKGLLKGKKDVGIVPCLVDDLLEKFFKICNTSAERQAQELGSGASVNNRVKQKHFLKLAVIEIHEEKVKDLLFLGNQEQISDRGRFLTTSIC